MSERRMQKARLHVPLALKGECLAWPGIFVKRLQCLAYTMRSLHMAGNSIGIIRAFYALGVRYVSAPSIQRRPDQPIAKPCGSAL